MKVTKLQRKTWKAGKADGGIQLFSMDTWPFPIKPARDHLSTGGDQRHSVFGSLESADLHPGDEGEGNAGHGGSALLLALLRIVDHRDLHVRGLSVLVLPLCPGLLCVGHAGSRMLYGACEKNFLQ